MQRILFVAILLLSLMICLTSAAWAGGLDDAEAASTAYQGGNYDESIRLYTKAIASGELSREDLSFAYSSRGATWVKKGEYDKAIADFTKAIEVNPKNAEAYFNRGNAWNDKGDHDRAIVDYTKAIEIDPKFAEAYYNRGLAWDRKGNHGKAKADYDKAREL